MKVARASGRAGVTARSRPSAGHVAMAAAAAWLILSGLLDAMTGLTALSLFSIAPLIAATVADERRTAVFGAAAVALAIGAGGGTASGGMRTTGPGLRWCAPSARWRSWWRVCAAGVRSAWRA